jgi:hypothetical protein
MEQRRAFVVALIAMLASAAACGSSGNKPGTQAPPLQPTATQAATTTPPAATPQDFVSKRYDFRVTLTKDWSEVDAQIDWDGKMLQGADSPAFADFTDPATGRDFVAAAAPVAKGTQLAQWRAAMVRAAPPVCSDSSSARTTTLAGEPALTWTSTCSDGYDVIKLAALHGDRGYMMFLPSKAANDDAVDRSTFELIRRSFRFTG